MGPEPGAQDPAKGIQIHIAQELAEGLVIRHPVDPDFAAGAMPPPQHAEGAQLGLGETPGMAQDGVQIGPAAQDAEGGEA